MQKPNRTMLTDSNNILNFLYTAAPLGAAVSFLATTLQATFSAHQLSLSEPLPASTSAHDKPFSVPGTTVQ